MKKSFLILSAILLCMSAKVASTPQSSFTYSTAPDSLKNSVFDSKGNALFDTLYLFQYGTWQEYERFYHTYMDYHWSTPWQWDNASIATIKNGAYYPAYTYTNTNGQSYTIAANTRGAYVGRTPNYVATNSKWGTGQNQCGKAGDFSNLYMYNSSTDGFLKDNRVDVSMTVYYGYHKIEKTQTYTITHTQEQAIKRSWGILSGYTYSLGTVTDKGYSISLTSTTYKYKETSGNVGKALSSMSAYQVQQKPANTNNTVPSETSWHATVDAKAWNPSVTANETNYKKSPITQTKTTTITVTNYIYVWAYLVQKGDLYYLDNYRDGSAWANGLVVTFDESTGAINGENPTSKTISQTKTVATYDTIAQVRHHLYTITTKDREMAMAGTMLDYYDTTWYTIDSKYNYSGQHTTTSKSSASYHEYDDAFWTTGKKTKIVNSSGYNNYSESLVNNKTRSAAFVYARQADGKTYKYIRARDYQNYRIGKVTNKKLYFSGSCEGLQHYGGDYLGFLQPVNCDIYLENARMKTQRRFDSNSKYTVFNNDVSKTIATSVDGYHTDEYCKRSAAVFYLAEEGTSRIHLKGNNYLSGNTACLGYARINVTDIPFITSEDIAHNMPKCSPAIEIQEEIMYTKDSLPIPSITCEIDDQWADGSHTNGYVDIATQSFGFSSIYTHHDVSDWNFLEGYRYAPPLQTGGDHGTFIINSGRVNLWPANAYTPFITKSTTKAGITITLKTSPLTSYMACGRQKWALNFNMDELTIAGISPSVLLGNVKASAILGGMGDTYPVGNFIVNGGTISAVTDPKSFGCSYATWDQSSQKALTKTAVNIDQEGNGQPLFFPNLQINGGTFLHPAYGTESHKSDATTWQGAQDDYSASDYKAVNKFDKSVSRTTLVMNAANTDYSYMNIKLDTVTPASLERSYVIGIGTANEYVYGMQTVISDASKNIYPYVPIGVRNFYKNYYVQEGQSLASFDTLAFNLTIDHGGILTLTDSFKVYNKTYYRRKFVDNAYYGISMPFQATRVEDPYGQITGYVEPSVNSSADNSNAFFYLYHLDDGADNYSTTGLDDTFRDNYTTHADGSYLKKGVPYVIKFPNSGSAYWANTWVTFSSEKGKSVNGTSAFEAIERPTEDLLFTMGANPTFNTQSWSNGELYLIDYANNGDDAFHAETRTSLEPASTYLLGNVATMQIYRTVGREKNTNDEVATEVGEIHPESLEGLQVINQFHGLRITSPTNQTIQIYSADGTLYAILEMVAGTQTLNDMPTGIYLLAGEQETLKAVVW